MVGLGERRHRVPRRLASEGEAPDQARGQDDGDLTPGRRQREHEHGRAEHDDPVDAPGAQCAHHPPHCLCHDSHCDHLQAVHHPVRRLAPVLDAEREQDHRQR